MIPTLCVRLDSRRGLGVWRLFSGTSCCIPDTTCLLNKTVAPLECCSCQCLSFVEQHRNLSRMHLQGKHAEARSLLDRALGINEAALGVDHQTTTRACASLGDLNKRHGFLDKASPLLEKVLTTTKRVYGPDHPWVADALIARAGLLRTQVRA